MKVVIIDYGSGNLASASKAFERAAREANLSADILLSHRPEDVLTADRIVLPGVGAFADCRHGLDMTSGLIEALNTAVHVKARPFLGICVGQQLMATRGLEKSITAGLDWISGDVEPLCPHDLTLKIPHMGWNTLDLAYAHPVMAGINTGTNGLHAYFVHSYHMVPDDPACILATTDYGGPITAIVAKNNMIGTQFHPEKSQMLGLILIRNFLSWTA